MTENLYALAVLILTGAAGGLFFDIEADILVPIGAAGLLTFSPVELSDDKRAAKLAEKNA